jgi:signal transduction histidine kinase
MQTNNRRIKVPVLIPLGLAILVLLASFILGAYLLERRNYIDRVRIKVEGAQLLFDRQLDEDARTISGLLDFIEEKEDLQKAWLEKNRDALLERSLPIFENIHSRYKVTHFYFLGLDRTCFLRVHNPAKYGDVIERFTMWGAVNQKQLVWGIELGTFGTFTLRVVHPWLIDGKLAGYIELGEEIEHILPGLKDVFKVELFVVIRKEYLTRPGWEEGMRMMGRDNADWDLLSKEVIVDSTFAKLSDKSLQNIKKIFEQKNKSLFDTAIEGRDYKGEFIPLIDAGKRHVGDLAVMKDITATQAALKTFSIALSAVCILVGILLCLLFYTYIRRIESKLTDVYIDLRDQIEKRKQAEEELQGAYGQMELKVQERTSELQKLNEELEMTIDRLTVANQELEQFAFIVSHQLREPVRKISIFGRMLADSLSAKLNDDEHENLHFMLDGADKIAQMVKGLKLYFETSVEKIKFEDVDLNLILEQIKGFDLADELGRANGTILVPEKLPVVKGSPVQLRRVLEQLIGNSLKYHRKDVKPEVTVRAYEQADKMVRIELEDNGLGIKEEYLKDVFNPFKRLHTGGDYEGIGIGLTICKRVVARHGGRVGVRSAYGRGTTLWFTLPLVTAAAVHGFAHSDSANS